MDREQILEKVLDFFRQKGIEVSQTQDVEKVRYLDQGWVDSFDLIDFIIYLENEFNIEFQLEEMQSDEFRTLGGLIDVISTKIDNLL